MIAATDGKDDKSIEADGTVVFGALGVKPLALVLVRVVGRLGRDATTSSTTTTAATASTTSSTATLLLRSSWLIVFTHFILSSFFYVKLERKQIFTAIEITTKIYITLLEVFTFLWFYFCLSQLLLTEFTPDLKLKDLQLIKVTFTNLIPYSLNLRLEIIND